MCLPNYFTATVTLTEVFFFFFFFKGKVVFNKLGYDFWTCSFNQQSPTSKGELCFLVPFSGLPDGSQLPCTVTRLNHPGTFFVKMLHRQDQAKKKTVGFSGFFSHMWSIVPAGWNISYLLLSPCFVFYYWKGHRDQVL